MPQITKLDVYGKASSSLVTTITINDKNFNNDLLTILQNENIPIASSCMGKGACHKCVINEYERSCMITAKDFIKTYGCVITVNYL